MLLSEPVSIFFQDQFENLDKHTQWGIDFLERYAKFVKERLEIEQNYAKQLRCEHTHTHRHTHTDTDTDTDTDTEREREITASCS